MFKLKVKTFIMYDISRVINAVKWDFTGRPSVARWIFLPVNYGFSVSSATCDRFQGGLFYLNGSRKTFIYPYHAIKSESQIDKSYQ